MGAGYFRTIGTRILAWREFDARDHAQSTRVAVVNETFVRRYWPGQDPLGQRFVLVDASGTECEIVGVAQDGKYVSLSDEPRPYLFLSLAQHRTGEVTLLVKTSGEAKLLAPAVRGELRAVDSRVPLLRMYTMEEHVRNSLLVQRLTVKLTGGLGSMALLMAAVGLYGVVSYLVGRRTREFGVRMAMGAQRGDILRLVLGQGLRLVLLGVTLGLVGTFGTAQVLRSFLFGVTTTSAAALSIVSILMVLLALLACYVPARRAARVDAVTALRYE